MSGACFGSGWVISLLWQHPFCLCCSLRLMERALLMVCSSPLTQMKPHAPVWSRRILLNSNTIQCSTKSCLPAQVPVVVRREGGKPLIARHYGLLSSVQQLDPELMWFLFPAFLYISSAIFLYFHIPYIQKKLFLLSYHSYEDHFIKLLVVQVYSSADTDIEKWIHQSYHLG